MAIIEQESSLPELSAISAETTELLPSGQPELDQLQRDALSTDVTRVDPDVNDNNLTHILSREGQAIGGAEIHIREVAGIQAAEVEFFGTNEANHHSAYLALLTDTIANNPQLESINGPHGVTMARVAGDILYYLPLGWSGQYTLEDRGTDVSTFNPDKLPAVEQASVKVRHTFVKTTTPV